VAWLQSQAVEFYDCGIQKLVKRYDNCLNVGGNYVEKQSKGVVSNCNNKTSVTVVVFW
jgi:hypothetical protein